MTDFQRPAPPPVLDDPGDVITRFQAWLGPSYLNADSKGNMIVRLTIPHDDRWKALLLDNAEGLMLNVDIAQAALEATTDDEIADLIGLE